MLHAALPCLFAAYVLLSRQLYSVSPVTDGQVNAIKNFTEPYCIKKYIQSILTLYSRDKISGKDCVSPRNNNLLRSPEPSTGRNMRLQRREMNWSVHIHKFFTFFSNIKERVKHTYTHTKKNKNGGILSQQMLVTYLPSLHYEPVYLQEATSASWTLFLPVRKAYTIINFTRT